MASTTTVTVDRVSNSGNALAQQQHAGKTIHVPAGAVGETYDVRLIDKGGYFVAKLVDKTEGLQASGPSLSPDTSDIGQDLLDPERNSSHSFEVRSQAAGSRSSGMAKRRRHRLSRRKK